MECSQCGTPIAAGAGFCTGCGQPVSTQAQRNNLTAESSPASHTGPVKRTSTLKVIMVVFLIIGSLSFLAHAATGSSFVSSNTPEGVSQRFMQALVKNDKDTAFDLCGLNSDEAPFVVGSAIVQMTDFSSDHKIRHMPKTYRTVKSTASEANVRVYDEKKAEICTLELEKIKGKWMITYCK